MDFIDLNFWPLKEWPVFNLADASIVAGVALLVLTTLWERESPEEEGWVRSDGLPSSSRKGESG